MNGIALAAMYDRLRLGERAVYDVMVSPATLAELRDVVFGCSLSLASHRALARDVLAGGDLGPRHPYRVFYDALGAEQKTSPWSAAVASKAATIRSVARDGVREPIDLYFTNAGLAYCHGYHRLAAALEAGLAVVPVRAHIADAELADLAKRLFAIYSGTLRFTLYQPVDHPFFALYPVQEANAGWADKVAAVVGVAQVWAGPVVEVGAHLGGLTRALRAAGVDARAVDVDPLYLSLQPLLEAVGCVPVPYDRRSLQALTSESGPLRLVMMGLMHHLMGKPDLWQAMRKRVLPWMRQAAPAAVVEMSLLPTYLGGPAAVAATTDDEVAAFWAAWGYRSTRLLAGAMSRVTYALERGTT